MKKLQHELDEAMPDSHTIPDITTLQRLPYLNAFIKEGKSSTLECVPCLLLKPLIRTGLRLYGAAPSLLERVVPSSTSQGSAVPEAFDLMGYELPPGTIVASQAW